MLLAILGRMALLLGTRVYCVSQAIDLLDIYIGRKVSPHKTILRKSVAGKI